MNKLGILLTKHRHAFLLTLLVSALAISSLARQPSPPATVEIPVTEAAAASVSALEAYRLQRDQDTMADIAALEALIAQPLLDTATREDAADRLQEIIDCRQAQSALEGALVSSSLAPCVAVISGGSLTIVTEKADITSRDSSLILTLAAAHAGISPENIRIMTEN
ncbi:MAG: SpoIIIAH-like family protein [Clostridiales bacterium]|nr:SpoIIIAH-like family protein [Clostridiales bacterium]